MEHIETLFTLARDNFILVFIIGTFASFLESFIPALPLMGIVVANSVMMGWVFGLLGSVVGSCTGTYLLFLLSNKFSHIKIFERIENNKVDRAINWVKHQGFATLFIAYSCPFIPGCLVTIACGVSNKSRESFVPAMISGRILMFLIASYIGNDLLGFIHSPMRIIFVAALTIISFLVGRKINTRIEAKHHN
ncbi:VTT domain-containing protein [Paraclostridium benzoelyticum]|uniref:TVP38/TMEM64 family protein n=1 Tax=Paraclostridium benzoelyticum TaxID=1629550 RepID=UPI0031CCE20C